MKKIIVTAMACTVILSCKNSNTLPIGHTQFANTTDYICKMEVQPTWTDTCSYKGRVYAFCGASCREEFLKDPEKYLAAQ